MYCIKCGTRRASDDADYCHHCGEPLIKSQQWSSAMTSDEIVTRGDSFGGKSFDGPERVSPWAWVSLAVAIALLVGACIFAFSRTFAGGPSTETQRGQTSAQGEPRGLDELSLDEVCGVVGNLVSDVLLFGDEGLGNISDIRDRVRALSETSTGNETFDARVDVLSERMGQYLDSSYADQSHAMLRRELVVSFDMTASRCPSYTASKDSGTVATGPAVTDRTSVPEQPTVRLAGQGITTVGVTASVTSTSDVNQQVEISVLYREGTTAFATGSAIVDLSPGDVDVMVNIGSDYVGVVPWDYESEVLSVEILSESTAAAPAGYYASDFVSGLYWTWSEEPECLDCWQVDALRTTDACPNGVRVTLDLLGKQDEVISQMIGQSTWDGGGRTAIVPFWPDVRGARSARVASIDCAS